MTIFPHVRLLRAVAAWTLLAVGVVALPWLSAAATAAALILVALASWDLLLLRRQARLELVRRLPERFYVGRAAEITLSLRNPGGARAEATINEDVPPALGSEPPAFGVAVDGHGETTLRYAATPRQRGDAAFGAALVLQRSPLGFFRRRLRFGDGEVARIYPDVSRFLRPEALDPRLIFAVLGVRPRRERGEGTEFESLRDYVPGDDPRRVHWAASARRGRPVTRLTQHERHHTVVVAIDASRLMASRVDERTKLDFAADAGLALAYGALVSGDRCGMALFDHEVRGYLMPRSHRRDLGLFVDFLRTAEPRLGEANFLSLSGVLATRQRQRALVVVLTDFVDVDASSFLAPLTTLARRHRVLLVAIRDRLYRGLSESGREPRALYRRLVLDDLLRERESALLSLRRAGVQTLDLPPEEITAGVLNRYLALRQGADW